MRMISKLYIKIKRSYSSNIKYISLIFIYKFSILFYKRNKDKQILLTERCINCFEIQQKMPLHRRRMKCEEMKPAVVVIAII